MDIARLGKWINIVFVSRLVDTDVFTDGAIGCQLQHSVVIRSGNIQVNIIIPGDKPLVAHCAQGSAAAGKVSNVVLFKKVQYLKENVTL